MLRVVAGFQWMASERDWSPASGTHVRYIAAGELDQATGGLLRIQTTFFKGERSEKYVALATYLGLAVGIVAPAIALLQAIGHGNWAAASVWAFFTLTLGFLAVLATVGPGRKQPEPTYVFQPFVELDKLKAWPRDAEVRRLQAAIRRASDRLVLVVGASGAGKSVLLDKLLRESCAMTHTPFAYSAGYLDFAEFLKKAASLGTGGCPAVIVLDQFEQYLASLRDKPQHRREREQQAVLQRFSQILASGSAKLIVALRKEWYYDLKRLDSLVPSPAECVDVAAPKFGDKNDPIHDAVVERFEEVLGPSVDADLVLAEIAPDGRALPLEVQIVGAALERDLRRGHRRRRGWRPPAALDLAHIRARLQGAINAYFDEDLEGVADRRVALKVLCALSARTRFRRREDLGTLLDVLFEPSSDVLTAIGDLQQQRLILNSTAPEYELTHDYLAEYFHQKSGSELDPTERDNILFHIEGGEPVTGGLLASREQREAAHPLGFAIWVLVPLAVLMIVRLLYFGIHWTPHPPNGPIARPLFSGKILDETYIPIYVAHSAWAFYVALIYHRILRHLTETRTERIFSRLTVVNMALCVIAAMVLPGLWLASIAWGGFVLGLKLMSIIRRTGFSRTVTSRIRNFGISTSVNMAILGIIGVAAMVETTRLVQNANDTDIWILLSSFAAIAMTYAAYALGRIHVQRHAVSAFLGLVSRAGIQITPHGDI